VLSGLPEAFARFFKLLDETVPNKTAFIQKLLKQHPTWSASMFRADYKLQSVILDDKRYSDALCRVIERGDVKAARLHLKHPQAEPEKRRAKPLLNFAAQAEKSEMVALLIEHGALQWIPSKKGNRFFARALEIVIRRDIEGTLKVQM
jgi:hypothetical protein